MGLRVNEYGFSRIRNYAIPRADVKVYIACVPALTFL